MVTQYNPSNPDIRRLIGKNWNILSNCDEIGKIFTELPLVRFRKLPNLRNIMTSARIRFPPPLEIVIPRSVIKACTRLGRCTYCPKLKKIESFTSFHTKKTYQCQNLPPKPLVTCKLFNLIYLVSCKACGRQYTGETKRGIRHRIYEHMRSVQVDNGKSTPVSRHFTLPNHSVKDMEFSVIHWMGNELKSDSTPARRSQELYYIWLLPTLAPAGINQFV